MFEGDDDLNLDDGPRSSRSTLFIRPDAPFRPVRAVAKKRKFPGPAGLLHSDWEDPNMEAENKSDDFVLLSQDPSHHFVGSAWTTMLKELGPHRRVLDDFNIRYIQENAGKRRVGKFPVLIAVLARVGVSDCKVTTSNCTLRDPTGEIEAAVDHKIYEESAEEFVPGAVVVLRDIAVLTGRKHYLIVTPKNLLTIYNEHTKITQDNPNLGVRITRDTNLDFDSILKGINDRNFNITGVSECRNLQSSNNGNLEYRNLHSSNAGNLECRNLPLRNVGNLEYRNPASNARNLECRNLPSSNVGNLECRILQGIDSYNSRHNYPQSSDCRNPPINASRNFGGNNLGSSSAHSNASNLVGREFSQPTNIILKSTNIFESDTLDDFNDAFNDDFDVNFGGANKSTEKIFKFPSQIESRNTADDLKFTPESREISFTAMRGEHSQILQEVFEGVPVDSFDDDF